MSWGEDWNGGPGHVGICPECGRDNYSCYDGLCDNCEELAAVPVDLEEVTDEEADEFTTNFLNLIK